MFHRNYLAHTQGKKHQAGLAKRAAMEAKLQGKTDVGPILPTATTAQSIQRVKIGRPGYEITKSIHYQTNQRCLSFQLHFPEIDSNVQPRHRFMSAFEQRVESPPDRRFQYLLIAAEPYETVAFKIPNEKIERSEFREDLFYRISEIPLEIPPLRDREGDIILLARFFFEKFNEDHGRKIRGFTKDALSSMESYSWPGNVRELQNRIKRAVIMTDGKQISASDLELDRTASETMNFNLRDIREKVERQAILRALSHVNGKVAPAAELLGVSRPTLYDLIKKLNINV